MPHSKEEPASIRERPRVARDARRLVGVVRGPRRWRDLQYERHSHRGAESDSARCSDTSRCGRDSFGTISDAKIVLAAALLGLTAIASAWPASTVTAAATVLLVGLCAVERNLDGGEAVDHPDWLLQTGVDRYGESNETEAGDPDAGDRITRGP